MTRKPESPIRVLIVEDHAVLRQGLSGLIESEPDLEVAAEAGSVKAALALLRDKTPDIALVDLSLPDATGTDLISEAKSIRPQMPCVVLTSNQSLQIARRVLDLGVLGYVFKDDLFEEVAQAIRLANAGKLFVSRSVSAALLKQKHGKADPLASLTKQEVEVLRLVAEGCTNYEIAKALGVEQSTAKTHRLHLRQKLGMPNAAELTRIAIQEGLVELR